MEERAVKQTIKFSKARLARIGVDLWFGPSWHRGGHFVYRHGVVKVQPKSL